MFRKLNEPPQPLEVKTPDITLLIKGGGAASWRLLLLFIALYLGQIWDRVEDPAEEEGGTQSELRPPGYVERLCKGQQQPAPDLHQARSLHLRRVRPAEIGPHVSHLLLKVTQG